MTDVRRLTLVAALLCASGACGREAEPSRKPPSEPPPRVASASTPAAADALMAAYDRGLDFLATKNVDGVVSVRGIPFTGVTAFCLLRMLERPGGVREKDRAVVDRTLAYLAGSVATDGSVNSSPVATYEGSVVIMALAASKRPEFKPQIERAVRYVESAQHTDPASMAFGGMGGNRGDQRADLSITYYALASLEAAGVPKDDAAFKTALSFLQRVQNRKANETSGEPSRWKDDKLGTIVRADDGGANAFPGWSKAGFDTAPDGSKVTRSCGSMTVSLLGSYRIVGLDATDPRVAAAISWMSKHWDVDGNPGMPEEIPERLKRDGMYYYFAAVAKAFPALKIDTLRRDDGAAIDWRAELSAAVLALQKPDGSWQSRNVQWSESVSVIATSYALTALAGCVR